MAVIIRKKVIILGEEAEIEAYLPAGVISKEDRLKANKLDEYLQLHVPQLVSRVLSFANKDENVVEFWYVFGKELHDLTAKTELIKSTDIESGDLWQAIWFYLPEELRPSRSSLETDFAELQHKRKDILSLSYGIAEFKWNQVSWMKRWDDWHQISFRPGIIRDERIINALGHKISRLPKYPTSDEFREIVKELGEIFPTKKFRDSTFYSDQEISSIVNKTVIENIKKDG